MSPRYRRACLRLCTLSFALVALSNLAPAQWRFVPLKKPQQKLSLPTCMAVARDGRIFLTERYVNDPQANPAYWGQIRVVDPVKGLLDTPFAKIAPIDARNERGLLGIALHPEFPKRPYVYVTYNYEVFTGPKAGSYLRLVRFTANGNVGSAPVTLREGIASSYGHNGGYLAFGPDKKLYSVIGDAWKPKNSQDTTPSNWNGKSIRLEADGTIPKDNPFGATNAQFTLGHRNSFGHAFHPHTGELFMSENGPLSNDEINILEATKNYGWPQELGNQNKPGLAKPILTWSPTIGPVGIEFYRGSVYPSEFYGTLWVCDFNKGQLRVLKLGGDPANEVLSQQLVGDPAVGSLSDVKMGRDGHMYAVSHFGNEIYRIEWTGTKPQLPDLLHLGTAKRGHQTWLVQRSGQGKKGEWMLALLGAPLAPPLPTVFGTLQLSPSLTFLFGPSGENGIVGVPLAWPNVNGLYRIAVSYQSAVIDASFKKITLTSNRVDLQPVK